MRAALPENTTVPVARPGEFAPLRIGPLTAWPPIVLAPMAGVTNYPFRAICREFGAGVYVSEMINARGFLEGNARTLLLASSRADESPRSVQIYGHEPAEVRAMARMLADEGVAHLDMNFGCPVPKVTRHGGGSAIPVKPKLLARIVRAAVEGARGVPVTIKVRKGIDDSLLTYLDAGRVAESEGAAAIGLDMTDEMLELARTNAAEAGLENVRFVKGYIEDIPLPDASVDVVISNCVINLAGDKPKVLAETARVLKPGGRFAVSDIIADEDMDEATRADMAAYTGCIAGALTDAEFREALTAAGLTDIEIHETHRVHDHAVSAIVRARKPLAT